MRSQLVRGAVLAVGLLGASGPGVFAAPVEQAGGASVVVAPSSLGAGDGVRVMVSGVAGLPATGTTMCIGFLGPGNNLETGTSPNFRSRLGTVAIGANGTGQADVRVPVQAAAGVYRITVGGCPPQPDLAPLAWIAEAPLTVTRGGPTGLPATGGGLPLVPAAGAALSLIGLGVIGARRRR